MKNSQILFIRYCLLFVIWDLLFIFLSVAPAHAYWIQYDWSGGDSQCLWYDTTRYDTNIYIESDESPPAKGGNSWNDTAVKVIEDTDTDTGVLLSSTYGADSPVVWKTIEWNFPSNDNELIDASGSNPFSRGDSHLRKDGKDLVALWHFDEGFDVSEKSANDSIVYDESTNENTGIVHGCTWKKQTEPPTSTADAVFGSALSFDADNGDSVVFGDVYNGVKTIEFWMNSDGTTDDSAILELASGDTVYISDAGNITTSSSILAPTIYVNGSEGASVSAGSWYHVAITTNSGINANNLKVGKAGTGYFDGAIDEVAIYSREKTAEEIWQDARGSQIRLRTQTTSSILDGIGKADSAIGLWHFDNLGDSTSKIAHDSSVYDNDGTWAGTGPTWYQWGVFGKCLKFDNTAGDYVDIGVTGHTVKSIEFWMKSDGADSAILQLNDNPSPDTVYISDDGNIETSFGDTIIYVNGSSGYSVSAGSWYHIAITTDNPIDASALKIGEAGTPAGHFSGLIDELGLYNYERSERQVKIDARGGQPWSPWSPYYKKGDEDDIVLFTDDFNDGEYISDWTASGPWLIDNIADDTGALKITTGTASNDTGIIQASDNTDWYNYQVEVKVKIKAASTNGQAGIILNHTTGTSNGYVALLDVNGDKLRLYKMNASGLGVSYSGAEEGGSLVSHSVGLTADQWYTLKAQYDGSYIRVYLGDTNHITYDVTDYTYKGHAALIADNDTIACFDNFKVYPIDRYCRYEATLTDNVNNDTTPYLYWVRLGYEETTRDDTLWSRIWQDKYGLHDGAKTWCPKDDGGTSSVLNCAEIDSADTVWCYNLENYGFKEVVPGNPPDPDGKLRVFVEVPVPATDHVNLRLGYRKTAALTTPGTWSDNETDYKWDDGDDWIRFDLSMTGYCDIEYDATPAGDTQIWECTFLKTQIADNFSKEAGYILWSRAVSSDGGTEPSPETFEPDSSGARQDTSIIYMMRDITPPGSSVEGWPWQVGQSGYQPVSGINNDNWIGIGDARLKIKGVQSSSYPDGTEGWRINSKNTWINFDSSRNDSGILVSVKDKNLDSTRADDCSGLKEKSFDDSPTRYVYSTTACGREWRNPDIIPSIVDITNIDDWAECDTDYDGTNNIRYLALGNSKYVTPAETYSHSMPNLGTRSSKQGRDIVIQFAQKDKAGNWGYSHPDNNHYYARSYTSTGKVGLGYYINYDITKPVPRIISAPRESNPSKYASFKFDDDSVDDSSLFCAFNARLERNDDTDKTKGNYSVVSGYGFRPSPPDSSWLGGWTPTSDNASTTFPIDYSPYWYRCSVKAEDEALNESDDYDTYYFQCMPVPNTIIYSGPSGIVVTSSIGTYIATFKFEGEGGSETPYEFAYSIDGSDFNDLTTANLKTISSLGYGNHVFRVRARNNGATDGDAGTDKTPASVAFTIVNPAQLPTIAPPSNPVKYWRQESE